eukprot:1672382-Amphidinium_carterae.1
MVSSSYYAPKWAAAASAASASTEASPPAAVQQGGEDAEAKPFPVLQSQLELGSQHQELSKETTATTTSGSQRSFHLNLPDTLCNIAYVLAFWWTSEQWLETIAGQFHYSAQITS